MSFKIGLYIRVSTEEQALRIEGSLDSQKHRLKGYVDVKNMQQQGWGEVINEYIDDGFSAKDINRPALQRLLHDLRNGRINTVLVTDISRLSRSIRDFCVLIDLFKETKSQFLSIKEQFDTTTAAGEMMLFNMINMAQFERRQISERVILNFHSRAMRGLRNGGSVILGYKADSTNKSTLLVDENEVPLVIKIFKTYIEERSIYATAARLREENFPFKGASGETWNTQTVKNILNNFSYIGMREVNKGNKSKKQDELKPHEKYQIVKASWPAIIDEVTFYTVQTMLSDNYKKERRRLKSSEERTFIFSGITTCGECGRALVGSTGHGKKNKIRYYVHRPIEGKPSTCSVKRYQADKVESALENHLIRTVNQDGYFEGLEESIKQSILEDKSSIVAQKESAEVALKQCDSDIKNLIRLQMQALNESLHKLYSEQLMELQELRKKERETLDRCVLELAELIDPKKTIIDFKERISRLQMAWNKASPKMKKGLLKVVVDRLVFNKMQIQIFYRQINSQSGDGDSSDHLVQSRDNVVVLGERRIGKQRVVQQPPLVGQVTNADHADVLSGLYVYPPYNAKAERWYIGKVGCGSWI